MRFEGVCGEVDGEENGAGAAAGTVDGDVVMEDGGLGLGLGAGGGCVGWGLGERRLYGCWEVCSPAQVIVVVVVVAVSEGI